MSSADMGVRGSESVTYEVHPDHAEGQWILYRVTPGAWVAIARFNNEVDAMKAMNAFTALEEVSWH